MKSFHLAAVLPLLAGAANAAAEVIDTGISACELTTPIGAGEIVGIGCKPPLNPDVCTSR